MEDASVAGNCQSIELPAAKDKMKHKEKWARLHICYIKNQLRPEAKESVIPATPCVSVFH